VAAVVWLWLAVYLVRRAVRTVAGWGRRVRRMPLPAPAQVTASSMAGVAALAMPTLAVASPDGVASDVKTSASPLSEPAGPVISDSDQATVQAGIEVPGGGWIPYPTALAVAAVSGLIWLHRRHSYQPGPPRFGRHDTDSDLQPLPATADTITAAVTADAATPSPPFADLALLDELPTGRVILHGPGATDAVRGLLITAVLAAALTHRIDVSVRDQDLVHLLGADVTDRLPGLTTERPDDPAPGARVLSAPIALARPMVTISRHPPASGTTPSSDAPGELVTEVVIAAEAAVEQGWKVRVDGTISGAGSASAVRLPVLARQTAADLLHLVGQYSAAQRPAPPPVEPLACEPVVLPGMLTVLDGCQLSVRGTTVRIRRSAGLQILAYLAVHPQGATTSDLVRAIWPGPSAHAITKRLHTTLTDLRHQLQPLLDDPVIRHDDRYQLNTSTIDTDLRHLRRAITAAATAATPDHQRAAVAAILEAYPGDLAAGFSWPWLHLAREALRREVIDAYLQLAASAAPEHAVDLVRAATAVEPYSEQLYRHGQRILKASGHYEAAEALQRAYTQRLITARLRPADTDHRRPTAS
jgi:DNA-binding SARP family transcriptional activator